MSQSTSVSAPPKTTRYSDAAPAPSGTSSANPAASDAAGMFQNFLNSARQQLDSSKPSYTQKPRPRTKSKAEGSAAQDSLPNPQAQDQTDAAESSPPWARDTAEAADKDKVKTRKAGEEPEPLAVSSTPNEVRVAADDPASTQTEPLASATSETPEGSDQILAGAPIIKESLPGKSASPTDDTAVHPLSDPAQTGLAALAQEEKVSAPAASVSALSTDPKLQKPLTEKIPTDLTTLDSTKTAQKPGDSAPAANPKIPTETAAMLTDEDAAETHQGLGNSTSRTGKPDLAIQGKGKTADPEVAEAQADAAGMARGTANAAVTSTSTETAAPANVSASIPLDPRKVKPGASDDAAKSLDAKASGASNPAVGIQLDTPHLAPLGSAEKAQAAQDSPAVDQTQLLDQVVMGLRGKIDAKNSQADIQLNPPNLGTLQVRVKIENGILSAQFLSEHAVVRNLLSEHMDKLRSVLEGQGIAVDRLAVPNQTPPTMPVATSGGSQTWQNAGGDGRSAGQQGYAEQQSSGNQNQSGEEGRDGGGGGNGFRQASGSATRWLPGSEAAPIDLVA